MSARSRAGQWKLLLSSGILGLALLGAPQAPAEDTEAAVENAWRSLCFRASKWGLSATSFVERSEVGLAALPRLSVPTARIASAQGPFWQLSIESRYVGRTSTQAVWFGRQGSIVFSRSWRRSGRSSYWNERAYAPDGVHRHRRAPASRAEAREEESAWTEIEDSIESYPAGWKSCDGLAEPAALLHLLSAGERPGENLCFLSHGSLWRLELKGTGRASVEVDYLDGRREPERRVEGTVETQRLELHPRPVQGESGGEFRLLGLQSDIVIFLDPHDGFPLRLTGRANNLGRLAVALTEVR